MVCGHDYGLVINPTSLESIVSRGTFCMGSAERSPEEVRFDGEKVTSVDWRTHPTLTHMDAPERIDVVMVNGDPNPDRPVPAAIANAIYDATQVRMRRLPAPARAGAGGVGGRRESSVF